MNCPPLTRLLGVLLAMPLTPLAMAGAPGTSLSELLACRHIVADTARLACFDRTSAAVARAPRASHARVPGPPTQAMKEALDPRRTFGLSHATIAEREASAAGVHVKDTSKITARIVRMGRGSEGQAVFDLDNGQVWEQLVPDGTDLYTKPGDSVRISRGWLDSYWLEAPSHHGCKVTRLR